MALELKKPALDVGIVTTNLEPMMSFYRDVLGFGLADPLSFPGFGTVHKLVVGESILRLFVPEQVPPSSSPTESFHASTGLRYMTLETKNLHEVVDACREFGVNVPLDPMEIRPGVFMCQVQDPDGNWIELSQS